jgi:hypothetical protein
MEEVEANKESATLENLYKKEETATVEVLGVSFEIRILSGVEYLEIVDETSDSRGTPNRSKYARRLVKTCVIKPEVDIDKLKPIAFILLLGAIEEKHGATELVSKKSMLR